MKEILESVSVFTRQIAVCIFCLLFRDQKICQEIDDREDAAHISDIVA